MFERYSLIEIYQNSVYICSLCSRNNELAIMVRPIREIPNSLIKEYWDKDDKEELQGTWNHIPYKFHTIDSIVLFYTSFQI